jgi:methionyl-tRNA synthetase
MDAFDLRGGAEAAWSLVATSNLYIQQSAPWALAKAEREEELDAVLGALGRTLYRLAVLVSPFMPGKAQQLWQALGLAGEVGRAEWCTLDFPPTSGLSTMKPEVLFPKPQPV